MLKVRVLPNICTVARSRWFSGTTNFKMPYPCPVKTYRTDTYAAISPTLPQLSTKGKNVVITGGGSGIGSKIAHAFAASGATSISILGRTEESLLQTRSELEANYEDTKVFHYTTDLVDRNAVTDTFCAIKSSVGAIDVLVANAGFSPKLRSIEESDYDDWDKAFEINVKGNLNLVKAFVPAASQNASVLNVTAGATHLPYLPGFSAYHASKLAAAKIFDYLHHEHPKFFVLNFHPGLIKTGTTGNPNALSYDNGTLNPSNHET